MPRRELDFRSFDDVVTDARHLLAIGYERAGAWSLGQICHHLELVMRGSMEGFTARFPWYLRLAGPVIKRVVLKQRKLAAGVKGPAEIMPPAVPDETAAVESLIVRCEQVRDHTGIFYPSPLLGRLSPEEWRQIHLIHASHHLGFLSPKPGHSKHEN